MIAFKSSHVAIAYASLVAATISAFAEGSSGVDACRNIQDSLLRLRCFDGTSAAISSKAPSSTVAQPVAKTTAPDFARYAVEPYRGPLRYPDFRGREREHAGYRTRLTAGVKSGPNFAGHLAMVEIGCGTSCRFVYAVDTQTGRVKEFPLGGEDYSSLNLKYRVDSRLVSTRWISEGRCKQEEVLWGSAAFQRGTTRDVGDSEVCYGATD